MKQTLGIFLLMSVLFAFCSCADLIPPNDTSPGAQAASNLITIPEVNGSTASVAEAILSSMGLIPVCKHEYHDTVPRGQVIRTEPAIRSIVEKRSKITVIISNGPKRIYSEQATISYQNTGRGEDIWDFYSPYISGDYLYIDLIPQPAQAITLENYALAGSDKEYQPKAVASVLFENSAEQLYVIPDTEYTFTVCFRLRDLNMEYPSTVAIQLYYYLDGSDTQYTLDLSFTISWFPS